LMRHQPSVDSSPVRTGERIKPWLLKVANKDEEGASKFKTNERLTEGIEKKSCIWNRGENKRGKGEHREGKRVGEGQPTHAIDRQKREEQSNDQRTRGCLKTGGLGGGSVQEKGDPPKRSLKRGKKNAGSFFGGTRESGGKGMSIVVGPCSAH